MKAVVTNAGTTGEIYPLLALAKELAAHGYRVTAALSPDYEQLCRTLGVEFATTGPSADHMFNRLTVATTKNPGLFSCYEDLKELLAPLQEALPVAYADLLRCCEDADVVISGHLQPAAKMVHEVLGIPFASVCATYITPNAAHDAHRRATQELINPFRIKLGLSSLREPVAMDAFSQDLHIFALSPSVIPMHPAWPPHFKMAGYFEPSEADWAPDDELTNFLAEGEPPVVVALGSMVHEDPEKLTALLARAGRLARCRLVIQRGRNEFRGQLTYENVHFVDYAPHSWLFGRSSCVVHHGGAGTTAAVFRAGVPAVIVPYILDQPLWAATAKRLGCASEPLAPTDMTAERLGMHISHILGCDRYRLAAEVLANKLRSESGVSTARVMIDQLLSSC